MLTFGARAQQRYSFNAVGYVDVLCVAGSNLVTNPLNAGDNSISNVLQGVPAGSQFLWWDTAANGYRTNDYRRPGDWTDGAWQLTKARAGFLVLPFARLVTFVGEPWPNSYWFTIAAGVSDVGVVPEGPYSHELSVVRWDAQAQRWRDETPYVFLADIGWVPEWPHLRPGEAARVFNSGGPLSFGIPGPPATMGVTLANARRHGADFAFEFSPPSSSYRVERCDDLETGIWRTVLERSSSTAEPVQVVVPAGESPIGFFRVGGLFLRGAVRDGTAFRFQFSSEPGVRYTVSRTTDLEDARWLSVGEIEGTGRTVAFTDESAAASTGVYRVAYSQ